MNTVRKDDTGEHHVHRIREVNPHIQDALDKAEFESMLRDVVRQLNSTKRRVLKLITDRCKR